METWSIQLLVIIILILINAFFAAAEIAVVSLNKNKINSLVEKGDKKAIIIQNFLSNSNKFLSTIQVGITLAGFLSSAIAAKSLATPLINILEQVNIPYAETISIFVVTLILAYFNILFGELIPKRLALRNSEKIALASSHTIAFFSKITTPFVAILSISTNFFMKLFKIDAEEMNDKVSEEEISNLIELGAKHGAIKLEEKEMIDNIFSFDDLIAKDIMSSKTNVFALDIDKPITNYYEEIFENMFSRIPVYQESDDNIIGILYMKDLMNEAYKVGFENVKLEKIIKKPYFISERKNIHTLLKELRDNKNHIAILIDEYGLVSGIVTIEDILEELVGEIEDEFDKYDKIIKLDENNYLIKGYVTINDLNEVLSLSLEENQENYDTVAGLIIETLGDLPSEKQNNSIKIDNLTFEIKSIKDNRIDLVQLIIN